MILIVPLVILIPEAYFGYSVWYSVSAAMIAGALFAIYDARRTKEEGDV